MCVSNDLKQASWAIMIVDINFIVVTLTSVIAGRQADKGERKDESEREREREGERLYFL